MSLDGLLDSLERDSMRRLKWLVIRETGISPVSRESRRLSGKRVLELACHIALDRRAAGASGGIAENPGFDMAKFRNMGRRES